MFRFGQKVRCVDRSIGVLRSDHIYDVGECSKNKVFVKMWQGRWDWFPLYAFEPVQIGDKVRCINAETGIPGLIVNEVYEISSITSDGIYFGPNGEWGWFDTDRFELVIGEHSNMSHIEQFTVGEMVQCIDNDHTGLVKGQEYEVSKISQRDEMIFLKGFGAYNFSAHRFQPLVKNKSIQLENEPMEKKTEEFNFKIGQAVKCIWPLLEDGFTKESVHVISDIEGSSLSFEGKPLKYSAWRFVPYEEETMAKHDDEIMAKDDEVLNYIKKKLEENLHEEGSFRSGYKLALREILRDMYGLTVESKMVFAWYVIGTDET